MSTSNGPDLLDLFLRTVEVRPLWFSQCPPRWNIAIEALSDDVLLEIFDLCLVKNEEINPWSDPDEYESYPYDAWYTLAHVCQRWRYVIFASPRRLNVQLHCSRRRIREMLYVWPAFPIVIWDTVNFTSDEDNITAALEHRDRICEIKLGRLTRFQAEKLVPLMQKSFPALTKLQLRPDFNLVSRGELPVLPVLPDSFLGGSAPHLRSLCLASIPFPAFPDFLLSANNPVYLYLHETPSGFISPEMVAALSALSKLKVMHLFFWYPDNFGLKVPAPPPLTRSVLPALEVLDLGGDSEYLDDFVGRIDVPSIICLKIETYNRHINLRDFFHLPQFIGRVETSLAFDSATFHLWPHDMDVILDRKWVTHGSRPRELKLKFLCDTDGPRPSLVEVCNTSFLPLSNIENFHISAQHSYRGSASELNATQWVEVIRHFSSAKSLYLGSTDFIAPVAFALEHVIEQGMTDVLPAIQELTVSTVSSRSLPEEPVREAIEQFVTARGLSVFETFGSFGGRTSAQDTHEG